MRAENSFFRIPVLPHPFESSTEDEEDAEEEEDFIPAPHNPKTGGPRLPRQIFHDAKIQTSVMLPTRLGEASPVIPGGLCFSRSEEHMPKLSPCLALPLKTRHGLRVDNQVAMAALLELSYQGNVSESALLDPATGSEWHQMLSPLKRQLLSELDVQLQPRWSPSRLRPRTSNPGNSNALLLALGGDQPSCPSQHISKEDLLYSKSPFERHAELFSKDFVDSGAAPSPAVAAGPDIAELNSQLLRLPIVPGSRRFSTASDRTRKKQKPRPSTPANFRRGSNNQCLTRRSPTGLNDALPFPPPSPWLLRLFRLLCTTKNEKSRVTITSVDVEAATELGAWREYMNQQQLCFLAASDQAAIKGKGLKGLKALLRLGRQSETHWYDNGNNKHNNNVREASPVGRDLTAVSRASRMAEGNNSNPAPAVAAAAAAKVAQATDSTVSDESQEKSTQDKSRNSQQQQLNVFDRSSNEWWSSQSMSLVTSLAGVLGACNLSDFPYFLYFYNGIPFVVAYLLVGCTVVVPTLLLIMGLGQMTQGNCSGVVDALHPRGRALTFLMLVFTLLSVVKNSLHVSTSFMYLQASFREQVPWKPGESASYICESTIGTSDLECSVGGSDCTLNDLQSRCAINAIQFAYKYNRGLLETTSSVGWFAGLYCAAWVLVAAVASRGFDVVHTIAIWTISAATVCLCFLAVFGVSLEGATFALRYLVSGEVSSVSGWMHADAKNPYMWSFAICHAFSSLSVASTLFCSLSSRNKPRSNFVVVAYGIFFLNFIFSLLASLAVFPFLGYLRTQSSSFGLLVITESPSYMLYSVIPLSLSYLPGAPVFCLIFYLSCSLILANSMLSHLLSVTDVLGSARLQASRRVKTIVVVLIAIVVSLLRLMPVSHRYWLAINYSCQQVAAPTLVFLFCILAVWIDGWKEQALHVGRPAVLLFGVGSYGLSAGILVWATQPSFAGWQVWLALLAWALLAAVAAVIACTFQDRRVAMYHKKATRETLWWLFIGNAVLLRADINDITRGPLPVSHAPLKRSKVPDDAKARQFHEMRLKSQYAKGALGLRYALPWWWAAAVKYLVPLACLCAVVLQMRHIDMNSPGDPTHGTYVFAELLGKREQKTVRLAYRATVIFSTSFFVLGLGFPGAFRWLAPVQRVKHAGQWRGSYDLTLRQRVDLWRQKLQELCKLETHPEASPETPDTRRVHLQLDGEVFLSDLSIAETAAEEFGSRF